MTTKPEWLKKLYKNKPWKYPETMEDGEVIEPYNFSISIGFDCTEIEKACDWIDKQMEGK